MDLKRLEARIRSIIVLAYLEEIDFDLKKLSKDDLDVLIWNVEHVSGFRLDRFLYKSHKYLICTNFIFLGLKSYETVIPSDQLKILSTYESHASRIEDFNCVMTQNAKRIYSIYNNPF